MAYVSVLNNVLRLETMVNTLPTKGNLVYEYNPFRNLRLQENKYLYKGDYFTLEELASQGITIKNNAWEGVPTKESDPILFEKGQLVDFITDQLQFSLDHPVHIIPQYSYDGSVNLIINDGINIPRLINSRFSATGKNTYEIIDRKGNNDTNIYDEGVQFDIDTSLYKRITKIPKLNFKGVQAGGNLKVGNYHFYFKFADADGNETDFVAESGLVSVFIGYNSPRSIHTGQKNENSTKQVQFILSNIDEAYNYVSVYYSRNTAEGLDNPILQCAKVLKKYVVNNAHLANIVITGFEDIEEIAPQDINLQYNIVDAVGTSAVCQNMLFMANVHKPDIPYNILENLSLRFLPYLKEVNYMLDMDQDYHISSTNMGYYDPEFIYSNTGYWGKELYRFGIVYILPNNELTPVFNIRGRELVKEFMNDQNFIESLTNDGQYNHYKLKDDEDKLIPINIKEETSYILIPEDNEGIKANYPAAYENAKGVVSFDPSLDTDKIYALDIRVEDEVIQELKKYVKGYFFVRQKRIPTILAQGITVGIDKISRTPTIPTCNGYLTDLSDTLDGSSYVETEDINDINYISEGFLSRYLFRLKKKSSSFWGSIGKVFAVTAIVTAVALGSIATGGGLAISAIPLSTGMSFTAFAVTGTAITAGVVGTAAAVVTGTIAAIDEGIKAIQRATAKKQLNGRYTDIPGGYKRAEKDESRKLGGDFIDRIIIKDKNHNNIEAIICPDYTINQPYYNQIFTGNEHIVRTTISQGINILTGYDQNYFSNDDRHFYMPSYFDIHQSKLYTCKIKGVPDNVKAIGLDDKIFRSRAGEAEEAWRYEQIGQEWEDSDDVKINSDIIRGSFGPYLAMTGYSNNPAETVEIMIPGYNGSNMHEYIQLRVDDKSTYYAISDRITFEDQDNFLVTPLDAIIENQSRECGYRYELYRGDCYICQFTHRVLRNFNDPSAPYNNKIVDELSWKNNYDPDSTEKYEEINLGDVNAVELGMWITFKVRSSNNLNIRTLDNSNIDEVAMIGHERGYYPVHPMSTEGNYKTPESAAYNKGFQTSVSERWNFELPDVPHIKNWFGTRIMYSDIHINDAYKNGFRVFQGTHYRDYTREYGEIVKLVPFESSLLCVFEHGIAMIPVNERAVAGQGAGGNVYINTSNVLPENPKIISDMFGSQWAESILKVPGRTGDAPQYVYGVDTVAKKIWRTDGTSLECISDFKVQEFLNNNITLGERELTPKIGIRNVKTHYNAYKRDVMFTFYDNTYGFEEKVWNLCWNELLQKFITFYSWVPSYMENINNVPFSFNRDTSKWVAKLGTSHAENSFADGITLTNVIIEDSYRENGAAVNNLRIPIKYLTKDGKWKTLYAHADNVNKFIAGLSLSNRILPDAQVHYRVDFELMRDTQENYKLFKIVPLDTTYTDPNTGQSYSTKGGFNLPSDAMFAGSFMPLYALCFNDGEDEWQEVYYLEGDTYENVTDALGNWIYSYKALYRPEALYSELYYRNSAGNAYADYEVHKLGTENISTTTTPQEWIENEEVLNELVQKYPPETVVGNCSTKYNRNNPPESVYPCTTLGKIVNEISYDSEGKPRVHGIYLSQHWTVGGSYSDSDRKVWYDLPIYKDITGKRPMLPKGQQVNPDKLVTLLNIKANISIVDTDNPGVNLSDDYYNMKASYAAGTSLINAGQYESTVAITPRWNLQFLSTDFWKHGQAGIIDIADDIYPTYWYGKQHPFEFEVVVVNDPSTHKIFQNLELVANKAKPESFHYEVIGESYDFAKDKPNMYFRQEALKALWQYNGADICYDRNFLKVQPKQQAKSADLPHRYYTRQDTVNEIEDYYISVTYPQGYDYRHLSGAEIVYYPNRQEYRIWNHAKAIDIDDLSQDDSRSIIAANCHYLEDRWKVTINPILVCYRNEYTRKFAGPLVSPVNTTWTKSVGGEYLPNLPIYNSPIPDKVMAQGEIKFPDTSTGEGKDNALYGLYADLYNALDTTNWLNTPTTTGYTASAVTPYYVQNVLYYKKDYFDANGLVVRREHYDDGGILIKTEVASSNSAQNRKEIDLKDKFMKVRIRYSGEELAVIDFLNTVYRISYA